MDTTLITCLAALRRSDPTYAHSLLRQYVARQPDDPAGWYLLSRVADYPAEGHASLQRFLETVPVALKAGSMQAIAQTARVAHPSQPAPQVPPRPARRVLTGAFYSLLVGVLCLLAAAVLPMFLGHRTLVILSGSMAPAIAAGSAVVVSRVPAADLVVGDVIAYAPDGAKIPVVHRIVSIGEADGARWYVTRGDANGSADPSDVTLPEAAWRVWYSVPLVGYGIAFAASRAGLVVLVVLPSIWLGLLQAVAWIKDHKQAQWLHLNQRVRRVVNGHTSPWEALRQEGMRRVQQIQGRLDDGFERWPIAAWCKGLLLTQRGRTQVAARWAGLRHSLQRVVHGAARWASLRLEPLSDARIAAAWKRLWPEPLQATGLAVRLRTQLFGPLRGIDWKQWPRTRTEPQTGGQT